MFASSSARLMAAAIGVLGAAAPAAANDPNRLQLLATEVASVLEGASAPGGPPAWIWILGIVGTLFSAFGGAYYGLRRFSISHVRTHEGWREITYRFRAKGPLRFGGDVIQRLGAVLADLENLTPAIRSRRRKPAPPPPTPPPEETASVPGAPPESRPRVTFVRRTDPEAAAEPSPSRARAPEPSPRAKRNRSVIYERARRLLAEGHDPWTVRELTGLKLVELDLLSPDPPASARRPEPVGSTA